MIQSLMQDVPLTLNMVRRRVEQLHAAKLVTTRYADGLARASYVVAEMRAALADQFARWQCPDDIVVVPALPRSNTGKVDKIALRTQAADG